MSNMYSNTDGSIVSVQSQSATVSTKMLWIGRAVSALVVLFLIFDGVIKVLKLAPAVDATVQLGYAERLVLVIGVLELVCLAAYIFPPTSVLGAILLTGYLGGAIATHVRMGSSLFSIIFPIMLSALIWGGLFLRDARLRALIPLRT